MFGRVAGTLTAVRWCCTREHERDPGTPASHAVGDPVARREQRCCCGCAQEGMMVNSPSLEGKAFLLTWSHGLGDREGKSVLGVTKREQGAC